TRPGIAELIQRLWPLWPILPAAPEKLLGAAIFYCFPLLAMIRFQTTLRRAPSLGLLWSDNQALDALLVDGLQRSVERCLLGRERLVPDRRTTQVIFDLENPTRLRHGPINANVQRDAGAADALAERRVDYLMLPVVIVLQ